MDEKTLTDTATRTLSPVTAFLRGSGILLVLAAAGWGLFLLNGVDEPAPKRVAHGFVDARGDTVTLILDDGIHSEPRVVITRTPGIVVDAGRRVRIGEVERILPHASVILVDRDGNVRAVDDPNRAVLTRLPKNPPESWAKWFSDPALETVLEAGVEPEKFWR